MSKNSNNHIDFIELNLKNGRKTSSLKELDDFKGKKVNTTKQHIKYSINKNVIKNLSSVKTGGFFIVNENK
ncbi:MAG TPA: hypothetical protein VIL99_14670 [Ignavibacteria bacterium]